MARWEKSNGWLCERADLDPGTVGDFLAGTRWPKSRTQGRIEKALGWPAGTIHQIGGGTPVDPALLEVNPDESPETVGDETEDRAYVSAPGPRADSALQDREVWAAIKEMQADIRAMRERLEGQ